MSEDSAEITRLTTALATANAEAKRMRDALITARHPLSVAASYVNDKTIAIGLKLHAESCVAALRAIDSAIGGEKGK